MTVRNNWHVNLICNRAFSHGLHTWLSHSGQPFRHFHTQANTLPLRLASPHSKDVTGNHLIISFILVIIGGYFCLPTRSAQYLTHKLHWPPRSGLAGATLYVPSVSNKPVYKMLTPTILLKHYWQTLKIDWYLLT